MSGATSVGQMAQAGTPQAILVIAALIWPIPDGRIEEAKAETEETFQSGIFRVSRH